MGIGWIMNNISEKELAEYIMANRTEDFPLDQKLEDFYKKVREWCDLNADYKQD